MATDPGSRQVAVMICDQKTGKVITGSMPTMTIAAVNAGMDTYR